MKADALIKAILDRGWSEKRIAVRVGCSQPTIHRIKHGQQRTSSDVMDGLRALYAETGPSASTAPSSEAAA